MEVKSSRRTEPIVTMRKTSPTYPIPIAVGRLSWALVFLRTWNCNDRLKDLIELFYVLKSEIKHFALISKASMSFILTMSWLQNIRT